MNGGRGGDVPVLQENANICENIKGNLKYVGYYEVKKSQYLGNMKINLQYLPKYERKS